MVYSSGFFTNVKRSFCSCAWTLKHDAFLTRYKIEVNGQIHAPTTLPWAKCHLYSCGTWRITQYSDWPCCSLVHGSVRFYVWVRLLRYFIIFIGHLPPLIMTFLRHGVTWRGLSNPNPSSCLLSDSLPEFRCSFKRGSIAVAKIRLGFAWWVYFMCVKWFGLVWSVITSLC